jgi:hypothetical protein
MACDRELHRFGRGIESPRLGLLDPHADVGDLTEPGEERLRDVGGHALEQHARDAGDLVPDQRCDLRDVEGRGEVIRDDGVRDVDRQLEVDEIVLRVLLVGRGRPLAAAAPEPADDDPAR